MSYTVTVVTTEGNMFELHYDTNSAAERFVEGTLSVFGGSFTIEKDYPKGCPGTDAI